MKYIRVYADEAGESHFQEVEVEMTVSQMAGQSKPVAAAEVGFYRLSAELTASPWHTSPRRQFVIYLEGHSEYETSDGDTRRVGPGSVLLMEDFHGKGHLNRNLSGERYLATIPLADGV
jgi:hypothetical protein